MNEACPSPKLDPTRNHRKSEAVDAPGATATKRHSEPEKPTNVELEVSVEFGLVLMSLRLAQEDARPVGLELPILALNRGFGNVARRQTSALR
jgi:hypothetical protein